MWVRSFGFNLSTDDICNDVRISEDKFLYVVGSSYNQNSGSNNYDVTIHKISSDDGTYQFGRSYDCGGNDYGEGIEV